MNCPKCNKQGCNYCYRHGKVNLVRQYGVDTCYEITKDTIQHQVADTTLLQTNWVKALQRCSVQMWDSKCTTTPDWVIPPGCPRVDGTLVSEVDHERHTQLQSRNFSKIYNRIYQPIDYISKNEQMHERKGTVVIQATDSVTSMLLQSIHTYDTAYSKVTIRKIKTNRKQTYYCIFVKGWNATWCLNKPLPNRNHENHNIYFYASIHGIMQKCFCSCVNKVRLNGATCRSFKGPLKPWTIKQKITLFPNMIKSVSLFEGNYKNICLSETGPVSEQVQYDLVHYKNYCYHKAKKTENDLLQ